MTRAQCWSLLLLLWCVHINAQDVSEQPAKPTLSATFATHVETLTYRQQPTSLDGETSAATEQSGNEENKCNNALIRRSHAHIESSANIDEPNAPSSLALRLKVASTINGGGYRSCDACLGTCIGIHPFDTDAVANGRASSEAVIHFPPLPIDRSFTLKVGTLVSGEGRLKIAIFDQSGKLINEAEQGDQAISINPSPNSDYLVRADLTASGFNRGTCCDTKVFADASVRISVEPYGPAPLAPANESMFGRAAGFTVPISELIRGSNTFSEHIIKPPLTRLPPPTPAAPDDRWTRTGRVIGGHLESGFPAVGLILQDGEPWCTGSLVGPKTVLTAAHCVDGLDVSRLAFVVANAASGRTADDTYAIVDPIVVPSATANGPSYDKITFGDDVALLYLDRPPTDPSDPSHVRLLAPLQLYAGNPTFERIHDLSLTFVGFGLSDAPVGDAAPADNGGGVKRSTTMQISDYGRKTFENRADHQNTCHGDSGGPALMVANHTQVIVGVVSSGDNQCVDYGINTRVDVYYSWLTAQIK
jgi:hypothetical protein